MAFKQYRRHAWNILSCFYLSRSSEYLRWRWSALQVQMLQRRGIWSYGLPSVTPFEQSWRGLWVQGGQGQKVLHHWHLKLLQQREKVLHIISPTFMKKSWSFVCSLDWKKSPFLSRWRGQAVLTENLKQNGVSVRPLIFPGLLGQCILVTYLRPT